MKKTAILFLLIFVLGGCNWFHKQTPASPAETTPMTAPATEKTFVSEPAKTVGKLVTSGTVAPVAKTLSPSAAPAEVNTLSVTSEIPPQPTETAQTQTAAFTVEEAQKVIAQKREEQTLPTPQADTPVFKKEELISLTNRHLSPLAYEPVAQEKTAAPWSQEELKYGVYYSFIKAGTAYIKNRGLTSVNGRKAYLIQTSAFSASVIDTVFKVRDINYSWIDAKNYRSLGYTQSLREGNYVRDEWVSFDYPNNRYYGEIKKKGEPREIAGELTSEVLDMLSSLYYVRAQKLEIGQDIVFDIINREERYPLVVKVLKKETVKTAAGKFHCIVVEPQFRGEGIFVSKGKSLKVWLTDDKYKMPVKMQTEVFIGSVSAELLEYKRN